MNRTERVWAIVLAGLVAVACGGSGGSKGTSGSGGHAGSSTGGTSASGGSAGNNGACTPGDTRACVGPGACQGGQQCSTNGTWGNCDCGAAGGGTGGQDASAGAGGTGAAGKGGSAGQGGSGGTTGPTAFAPSTDAPGKIVASATDVYWSSPSRTQLQTCPVSGCSGPPQPVQGLAAVGISDLAYASGCLFYAASSGSGAALGRGVCSASPLWAKPGGTIAGIGVSSLAAVWSTTTDIMGCALVGGACTSGNLVTYASGLAQGVDVLGNHVYWADYNAGTINTCPISGCSGSPTILASSQTKPRELVAGVSDLVWRTQDGIYKCATAGCNGKPTALAVNQDVGSTTSVVQNAGDVFWVNQTSGTVVTCPLVGCNGVPKVLATGQQLPTGIAVTASRIFWTTKTGVMVMPR